MSNNQIPQNLTQSNITGQSNLNSIISEELENYYTKDETYSQQQVDYLIDQIQPASQKSLNEISQDTPNTNYVNMNNQKLKNLSNGVDQQDAVTKAQLDVVTNKLIVSANGQTTSIQQQDDQERLTNALVTGLLSGVVSTGISSALSGMMSSSLALPSSLLGTASGVASGLLSNSGKFGGQLSMDKPSFESKLDSMQTDPTNSFQDTIPDDIDTQLEELKEDDVVNMMSNLNLMEKLIVKKDLQGPIYYLPQNIGAAGPSQNLPEYTNEKQVVTFASLQNLTDTLLPQEYQKISDMDNYLPLQGTVLDLNMNDKKITNVQQISNFDQQDQSQVIAIRDMKSYVQSQTPASDVITNSDNTCQVQTKTSGIETKHNNQLIQKQYFSNQGGSLNSYNVIDSDQFNTEIKGKYNNKLTIDRPGFQKDTFISAYEETLICNKPLDKSNTHLTDLENQRLVTKEYTDQIYVKKTDVPSVQQKIKNNTSDVKVECFDTYIGIQDQNQQQMLYVQSSQDNKIRTILGAEASNTLDLQSFEGIRMKETNYNTTIADFEFNRIDLNKATYLQQDIEILESNQLVTKLYVDTHSSQGQTDRIQSQSTDTQLIISDTIEQNYAGIKLQSLEEDLLFIDKPSNNNVQIKSTKQLSLNSDIGITMSSQGVTQLSTFKDPLTEQIMLKANVGIIQENVPYGNYSQQQLVNKTYCDQKQTQAQADLRYYQRTDNLNDILLPDGPLNLNNQLITNLSCDGTSNLQATNVLYVDNNYINKSQGVDQIKKANNKSKIHCDQDNRIMIRSNDRDMGYLFQPVGQTTTPMGLLSYDKLQFTSQLNSTAIYGGQTVNTSPIALNTNLLNINSQDSSNANVQNMLQITSQYSPTMNIVSGHAINPLFSNANLPYSAINFEGSLSSVLYISPQTISDSDPNNLIMVKQGYTYNPINIGSFSSGSLQNAFTKQTGYTTQIIPTDSRSFVTKKYVDDNIPNLSNYSTTTQIKAFNDMTNYYNKTDSDSRYYTQAQTLALSNLTNYYNKTQSDARYLQTVPEITYLSNGTQNGLYLTPGLLNLKLSTDIPYFQILNQSGTTEIYYKGQNTRLFGIDNTATSQVQQFGSNNASLKNMSLFQNTTEFGIQDSTGNPLMKFNPTASIKTIMPTRIQTTLDRTGLTLDNSEFITKGDLINGRATISVSQSQVIQDSDIILPGGKFFRQPQNPVLSQDVVTKGYFDSNAVNSSVLTQYAKLSSATQQQFDSNLILGSGFAFYDSVLPASVTDLNRLVNKNYVDSKTSSSSGPMKAKGNFPINLNPATNLTGNYAASNVTLSGQDASVSLNTIKYYIGNITGTNPTVVFYGGQTFGYEATFCYVFNDDSNLLTQKTWICQIRDRYSGSTYDSATGWSVLTANNNISNCLQIQRVTNASHVWYNKTVVTILLGQYSQQTNDFVIDLLAF